MGAKKGFGVNKTIEIADYIINNKATILDTAEKFGCTTPTIRHHIEKMKYIDKVKYNRITKITKAHLAAARKSNLKKAWKATADKHAVKTSQKETPIPVEEKNQNRIRWEL